MEKARGVQEMCRLLREERSELAAEVKTVRQALSEATVGKDQLERDISRHEKMLEEFKRENEVCLHFLPHNHLQTWKI